MNVYKIVIGVIFVIFLTSCTLTSRLAKPLIFTKKTEVFDVKIYATAGVEDVRMLHAANVLAEYLDNNEDGHVDNLNIYQTIKDRQAYLVLYKDEDEEAEGGMIWSFSQNLYNIEIFPEGSTPGNFDATLEEVLHLITDHGYAQAYPDIFGLKKGSQVANAMDRARGGYFKDTPSSYPSESWYHYYDDTCNYACMITEYLYWALTTKLGAQEYAGRSDEISEEWEVISSVNLQIKDSTIYSLIQTYQDLNILPDTLPDGSYLPKTFLISEIE
ncbi:hypothetical protein DID74_02430 [Candidatus Marinamargulisbacteria bacterium SCGC AG-333-B06]|nr:hypothetical protein DID74_02430 [Candidatus Marinamargulisbacteria bacterium SCGC AG-333-B06]